jgi:16S rRNA (adenine1518-N6/adenine1519-N6)-dimethyltransferase
VLRNCVAGLLTENDLIDAGVDPQARPEAVPMEQFVALANRLASARGGA